MNQTKTCAICHIKKEISEFPFRKDTQKYRNNCKICQCEQANQRYRANKEYIAEQKKQYYQDNKEHLAEYKKQYYKANKEANKEQRSEYAKRWYKVNKEQRKQYNEVNKEQRKERAKQYYRTPVGKAASKAGRQNRRARKLNNGGKHIAKDILALFELQSGVCPYCKIRLHKSGNNKYHVDHILPLSKGGSNDISNLQLLCPKCNLSKSAKSPDEFAALFGKLF